MSQFFSTSAFPLLYCWAPTLLVCGPMFQPLICTLGVHQGAGPGFNPFAILWDTWTSWMQLFLWNKSVKSLDWPIYLARSLWPDEFGSGIGEVIPLMFSRRSSQRMTVSPAVGESLGTLLIRWLGHWISPISHLTSWNIGAEAEVPL